MCDRKSSVPFEQTRFFEPIGNTFLTTPFSSVQRPAYEFGRISFMSHVRHKTDTALDCEHAFNTQPQLLSRIINPQVRLKS